MAKLVAREGLKNLWPVGRAGSSPVRSTIAHMAEPAYALDLGSKFFEFESQYGHK